MSRLNRFTQSMQLITAALCVANMASAFLDGNASGFCGWMVALLYVTHALLIGSFGGRR